MGRSSREIAYLVGTNGQIITNEKELANSFLVYLTSKVDRILGNYKAQDIEIAVGEKIEPISIVKVEKAIKRECYCASFMF